ncbi:MAG: type II toxin-antitoxin system TacA family antitoxin [Panacagrimonas sp.]
MHTANDRLEMRLQPEEKGLLARAAQIEGVKLSQFILAPAIKRARKVIADAEQITTSAKGYKDVLDALAKPPKPTKALIAAMRDYESAGIQWR